MSTPHGLALGEIYFDLAENTGSLDLPNQLSTLVIDTTPNTSEASSYSALFLDSAHCLILKRHTPSHLYERVGLGKFMRTQEQQAGTDLKTYSVGRETPLGYDHLTAVSGGLLGRRRDPQMFQLGHENCAGYATTTVQWVRTLQQALRQRRRPARDTSASGDTPRPHFCTNYGCELFGAKHNTCPVKAGCIIFVKKSAVHTQRYVKS
ncbi:hypothetical protein LTR56_014817 [Elasticomyces elasticus]|nr:hypothetical protein LTR56_014817 [Elasticomyces elasticus]KAK5755152.1 hypothetical protein LTS12_014716 [Elasticomyces elasticus]